MSECDKDYAIDSNKMELSGKVQNRTHHTRFFEKIYGNLEKSDDGITTTEQPQREIINSPSESSASSSEIFSSDFSVSNRNISFAPISNDLGLNNFTTAIMPSHFGLRLPLGAFPNDPHNHFAAFCKLIIIFKLLNY